MSIVVSSVVPRPAETTVSVGTDNSGRVTNAGRDLLPRTPRLGAPLASVADGRELRGIPRTPPPDQPAATGRRNRAGHHHGRSRRAAEPGIGGRHRQFR